jgi:hypothetical protein
MKNKTCKHCGRWLQDHRDPIQEPEKFDEVLEGYSMSLLECLQSQGFELKEPPSSKPE